MPAEINEDGARDLWITVATLAIDDLRLDSDEARKFAWSAYSFIFSRASEKRLEWGLPGLKLEAVRSNVMERYVWAALAGENAGCLALPESVRLPKPVLPELPPLPEGA